MRYLLLSHHRPTFNKDLALWWAPKAAGYTIDVDKAGRYDACSARDICRQGQATMIPEDEAKKMVREVVIFGDIPNRPRREP
ncbi:MAG: hypothetical protein V4510_09915 [bacterium]